MQVSPSSLQPPSRPAHTPFKPGFVYLALGLALSVGFGYAALLAVMLSYRLPEGDWWIPMMQAHGHAQLMGWTGLFIMGVSLYFIPRLTANPLAYPGLSGWVYGTMGAGIFGRTVLQPLLALFSGGWIGMGIRWGLGLAVVFEAFGVGLYLFLLATSMALFDPKEGRDAYRSIRLYLLSALLGWAISIAVTSSLGVFVAWHGHSLLNQSWNRLATDLYLGLVLLPMAMAFSVRTFPLYLRLPPARWPVKSIGILYFGGLGLELLMRLLGQFESQMSHGQWGFWLEAVGQLIKSGALLWFVWELDVLLRRKPPWIVERQGSPPPNPKKRPRRGLPDYGEFGRFERLLYWSYGWLVVAAGLEMLEATMILGGWPSPINSDGVRHVYLLGFISLLILGMAPRMIPGFIHKRGVAFPGLVSGSFWLGNGAVFLRVVPALLPAGLITRSPVLSPLARAAFALSGFWGWLAVLLLGWNMVATCSGSRNDPR